MKKIKPIVKIAVSAVALVAGGIMLFAGKDSIKNAAEIDMELCISARKNGSIKSVSTYRITKDSVNTSIWKSLYGEDDIDDGINIGISKVSKDEIVVVVSGETYTIGIEDTVEIVEDNITYQFTYNRPDNTDASGIIN